MILVPYKIIAIRTDDDDSGKNIVPYASVSVKTLGGVLVTEIYQNNIGSIPKNNPFILNASGEGDFWVAPGFYQISISGGSEWPIFLSSSTTEDFTSAEKTKLAGISTGATANSADSALRDRATHTGTQAISTVSGLQSSLDSKVDDSQIKTSLASPDNSSVPSTLAVASAIADSMAGETPRGAWNASTNTPALASSVGTSGYWYEVSVAGATNLNGETGWQVGDKAVFNGIIWTRIPANAVRSVDGRTGNVILNYDTPAQAALASLPVGAKFSTKGANSVGDGGHGDFIVEAANGTPDGYSRILLANGNHAVLQLVNDSVKIAQFGSGDAALGRAFAFVEGTNITISGAESLAGGAYEESGVSIGNIDISVPALNTGNTIQFQDTSDIHLNLVAIDRNKTVTTQSGSALAFRDVSDAKVSNTTITNMGGVGNSILSYSAVDAPVDKPQFDNIHIEASIALSDTNPSSTTNGIVSSNSVWGRMSNILARGVKDFAAELKDNATYNYLSGIQIRGGYRGLWNGSQTVNHPSKNVFNGAVLAETNRAIYAGFGSDNLFNCVLWDSGGAPNDSSDPEASRIDGANTSVYGFHTLGDGAVYGVRFRASSTNNYVSMSAHHSGVRVGDIQSGATRNVLSLDHPGTRNSIYATNVFSRDGTTSTGSSANVIYCHALGQYWGSISGTFEWRLETPATMPTGNSGDKWRYTNGGGNSYLAIQGDAGTLCGFVVNQSTGRKSLVASDANGWQVLGNDFEYRLASTAFRHSTDGLCSNGAASYRWSTVYASTGTINTSDEREKTDPIELSDEVLDAWGDVSIVSYKWLESIRLKGDLARTHIGVIAQSIESAFSTRGLSAFEYGLLCYDEWDDKEAELDEDGNIVSQAVEAGNRYGIRPDQCLFLESAYQRRRTSRMEERLARLESIILNN